MLGSTHSAIQNVNYHLKATDYLSVVADNVHPSMATIYPFFYVFSQLDNDHKAKIINKSLPSIKIVFLIKLSVSLLLLHHTVKMQDIRTL